MKSAFSCLAVTLPATLLANVLSFSEGAPGTAEEPEGVIAQKLLDQAFRTLRRGSPEKTGCRLLVEKSLPEALVLAKAVEGYQIAYFDSFKRGWQGRYSISLEGDSDEKIRFIIESRNGECFEFYVTLLAT